MRSMKPSLGRSVFGWNDATATAVCETSSRKNIKKFNPCSMISGEHRSTLSHRDTRRIGTFLGPSAGRLCRKRVGLGFDFHESAAKCCDAAIKSRRLAARGVGKKAPDPRLKMCLEDVAVGSAGSNDLPTGKAGHDFEKYRNVILGLRLSLRLLKANLLQRCAKPGEGAPIERTCQII